MISGIGEKEAFSMVQIAESVSPIPRTEKVIAKSMLYNLIKVIKKFKVTTLLISELYEEQNRLSADGISEFITDGVIRVTHTEVGGRKMRFMEVLKMRNTKIDSDTRVLEFGDNGITVGEKVGL